MDPIVARFIEALARASARYDLDKAELSVETKRERRMTAESVKIDQT